MPRIKLDKIDRKIIRDLQEQGRMTNVELAQRAGISAPPCLRRVRALEEAGVIKSYHAKVDPISLGYGITVFATIKLGTQSESDLNQFNERLAGWPMVRESYIVSGDYDYLLKIVAKDWEDYQRFVTLTLTAAPNVASVRSTLLIRATKEQAGVPIEE